MSETGPDLTQKVWVLAGNYQQYRHWCRENRKNPYIKSEAEYVGGPYQLRGQMIPHEQIVRTGSWDLRRDMVDILIVLRRAIQMHEASRERV